MSDWTEVKIIVDAINVDKAGDIASMVVPYGIYIEDYSELEKEAWEIAHIDLIEQDLLEKDRTKIIVHHYISPELDAQESLLVLQTRLSEEGVEFTTEIEYVNQEDWETGWKAYYHALPIGENLMVCPSWESCETDRKILKLDPGMAFGTGTHETTNLCL